MIHKIFFVILLIYFSECSRQGRQVSLQQLQNKCLTQQPVTNAKDKTCTTAQKVKMQMATVENGILFCITYKKAPGDAYNAYDVIRIDMHHDYDLQYSGANVIDYENPSFKVYIGEEYNARFAIFSNNSEFRIYAVTINGAPQSCNYGKKGGRVWPHGNKTQTTENEGGSEIPSVDQIEQNQFQPTVNEGAERTENPENSDKTQSRPERPQERYEPISPNRKELQTNNRKEPTTPKTLKNTSNSPKNSIPPSNDAICGMVQKMIDLKDFSMPTNPGQYPFTASIHQVVDEDENNSIYKCSGSIIDQSVILTSVNCLMDSNTRLLSENELQIHVAQYSKNHRGPKSRIYEVGFLKLFCWVIQKRFWYQKNYGT